MKPIPFADVRAWMFDAALPFWGEKGLDHEHGGFHEELDLEGNPADIPFKRVRVTCRQVYVFSHAALLGWSPGAALAERGVRYLLDKAWQGPEQGWARRLSRDGAVIDGRADLYDIAFVMFAFAWRHRQARDKDSLRWLHETLCFVQERMRHGEGFWHMLPPEGPRIQNPHMHLLEASLAAFDATQDQVFLDQAKEIVGLFKTRFFDGATLGEYFTEDWKRIDGEKGRIVEPGHQFEWAWILTQYQRVSGEDCTAAAQALVDFSERHGVDPQSQATFNSVRDDGAPIDPTSRTWPNTERLKAYLALFEATGRDPRAEAGGSTRLLLDRYLAVKPYGSWLDHFDAEGRPIVTTAPTSTLYHVFLAFAELLRLENEIKAL